jgi:hypothetical protein
MKKPIVIMIILGIITILVSVPIVITITLPSSDELYYCAKPFDSLLVKIDDYYVKHPTIITNYGDTTNRDTIQKVTVERPGRTNIVRFQIKVDTLDVVLFCQVYHSKMAVRCYEYEGCTRHINWSSEYIEEQAAVLSAFEQQVMDQLECPWVRDWGQHWASIIAMFVIEWSRPFTHLSSSFKHILDSPANACLQGIDDFPNPSLQVYIKRA